MKWWSFAVVLPLFSLRSSSSTISHRKRRLLTWWMINSSTVRYEDIRRFWNVFFFLCPRTQDLPGCAFCSRTPVVSGPLLRVLSAACLVVLAEHCELARPCLGNRCTTCSQPLSCVLVARGNMKHVTFTDLHWFFLIIKHTSVVVRVVTLLVSSFCLKDLFFLKP